MTLHAVYEPLTDAAANIGSLAALTLALGILGRAILGTYRVAKRIDATNTLVQKELRPNGGTSLRDSIDRIEKKADQAVSRAEDAATHAHFAAQHAASALARIEALEGTRPSATAIVVNPASIDPEASAP